jgi:hypothetical protein
MIPDPIEMVQEIFTHFASANLRGSIMRKPLDCPGPLDSRDYKEAKRRVLMGAFHPTSPIVHTMTAAPLGALFCGKVAVYPFIASISAARSR